jgi:carboxyl-terminal processing protease
MRRSALTSAVALAGVVGLAWLGMRRGIVSRPAAAPAASNPSCTVDPAAAPEAKGDAGRWGDRLAGRTLQLPSGAPAALSCREARRIIAQVRQHLASQPEPVDPQLLSEATVDWLDPHGLWSASPDAPLAALLRRRGREFLAELEAPASGGPECRVADEAGIALAGWVASLASVFDDAATRARPASAVEAWRIAAEPAFEDRAVVRPGRELAHQLGHAAGVLSRSFGGAVDPFVKAARQRFVPELSAADWSRALLAAALRAYLPQIDPHGGWAPLDEETSLYEVDLEAVPPPRLWDHMVRTAVGVRVDSGAADPMESRDLVLEVSTVATAGLSVEQVDQLAIFDDAEQAAARPVVVLREGESQPRTIDVPTPVVDDKDDAAGLLPAERVPYGDGDALVIEIGDVPDDLGDLLAVTIAKARAERPPRGILLDLRGNGGGSTDGANAALGLFLPGAPLFPMRRRDGVIETERAPEPPETDRWTGPVATLVDGDTASAAEMIAGALASYRRGSVAGFRTYGKGCAQEYVDDEVHTGVLRLTTLIYALPDGSPVQKIGLSPGLYLGPTTPGEREATLSHAMPTWRGPDVRDRSKIGGAPWPLAHGRVGPCRDEAICRTLRALGAPRSAVARGRR